MPIPLRPTAPTTLERGKPYVRVENQGNAAVEAATEVNFIAYDPCPAFVIVFTKKGERIRCLREEIHLPTALARESGHC